MKIHCECGAVIEINDADVKKYALKLMDKNDAAEILASGYKIKGKKRLAKGDE